MSNNISNTETKLKEPQLKSDESTHNFIGIFQSNKVPVLQNRVYKNSEDAKNCPFGSLNIIYDPHKKYVYNHDFDEDIIKYDSDYDNSVPSKYFMDYYDEIGRYLVENYDLKKGTVLDIGCGKGTFIKNLVSKYSYVKAVGIDPSYEDDGYSHDRLKFIPEHFDIRHIQQIDKVSIILCRHVLEHIPNPTTFLRTIFKPFKQLKNIPLFIEVPSLDWILENRSFWDFYYEHVNYFDKKSLQYCINNSGASNYKISSSFNGQYLWSESIINSTLVGNLSSTSDSSVSSNSDSSVSSNSDFKYFIDESIRLIAELSMNKRIVLWGMASKGVLYSLYLLQNNIKVDKCIDINVNKQGKFAPLSGLKIYPPNVLLKEVEYLVICMNPNYSKEIYQQCIDLGLNILLIEPSGKLILQ
jgi:SAM-dependent methyltransferase